MPHADEPTAPPCDGGGTLARGTAIGRYVVLGLVGRGAIGEVYAAHDPELSRKVAIKLLRASASEGAAEGEDRARFMREAQAIARLSHPNVVVIHDVGTFRQGVFIAMEFVDGNTVGYWMQARLRPWREVLRVFAAAGSGLAAAHDKDLVHRDFKPENIMIRADGEIRVMDFGLARIVGTAPAEPHAKRAPVSIAATTGGDGAAQDLNSTRVYGPTVWGWSQTEESGATAPVHLHESGLMVGTPAYMSPEQFQGKQTDARGDQFSFCVALYEALYGEGPFQGGTLPERATNVTTGNVREAPVQTHVPAWVRKVVLRGLQVSSDDRWPSMRALLSALDENACRLAEIDEWLAARGAPPAD